MTVSTYSPVNALTNYLPLEFAVPDDPKRMREFIQQRESTTATVMNLKENGQYDTSEKLTGQQWFSTASGINKPRYSFRKVINFGALPNNATKTSAHGLTIDANTILTRLYGSSTNPSTKFIPIPYASTTAANSVEIFMDSTNISVTTGIDYTAFTVTYIVVEIIKF
jgi:hypothetical protein